MSTHDEVGVGTLCTEVKPPARADAVRAWSTQVERLGVPLVRYAIDLIRVGRWSALPGAKPATYRTTGTSCEHGNLDRSAEPAKLCKLPRPAMSPTRGRAFVVVGARESRAHGEGRQ
jgi:hypothetical protein